MITDVLVGGGTMWGVSGPAFLGWYLAVTATLVLAVGSAGHRSSPEPCGVLTLHGPTDPYLAASLNGGGELALLSAVVSLHGTRRLRAERHSLLRIDGAAEQPTPALERAVLTELAGARSLGQLARARHIQVELEQLRGQLIRHGLLLGDGQRARMRYLSYVVLVVLLVGVARLVGELIDGGLFTGLLLCVLSLGVVATVLMINAPTRTARGRQAASMLRTKYGYLDPATRPDWDAHGPTGAALAVAVFGFAALRAANPGLADEVVEAGAGLVGAGTDRGGPR
ncbi:TIGR04222 domain-containing membrane protein [Pseudonocardia spinosispora]|uniref:TIGR04222 domain-containing membrane protein n=1 Tax=Pseudonocardia spinosispora TaxID=103441 RepID=UPI0012EB19D0|nr:TIGR04222 domain-containing membrane protein [Pseudonocardia spinosispora]